MKNKSDYQEMLLKMVRPLTRHYTDDGLGFIWELHQQDTETELRKWKDFPEFCGELVSYWAGGGEDETLLATYQRGLAAGTDPTSPFYWGESSQ